MSDQNQDGFIHLRNGLLEHVQKGWMDSDMVLAYLVLLRQCDWATGVWTGSAARLKDTVPAWSLSTCIRVLSRLARGLYIESEHIRGSRGNYPVLINNYEPIVGGKVVKKKLRKTETIDWRTAVKVTDEGHG
jgi:hypothetical protein